MTFRPTHDVGPRTQCISGLNHAAYGLPVNASRPGSPQAHASLGSGWRPTLAGWDWIPTGFRTRFQRSHHGILSPLTGLSRHTRRCLNTTGLTSCRWARWLVWPASSFEKVPAALLTRSRPWVSAGSTKRQADAVVPCPAMSGQPVSTATPRTRADALRRLALVHRRERRSCRRSGCLAEAAVVALSAKADPASGERGARHSPRAPRA